MISSSKQTQMPVEETLKHIFLEWYSALFPEIPAEILHVAWHGLGPFQYLRHSFDHFVFLVRPELQPAQPSSTHRTDR
jgi:hypothetical protein